MGHVSQIDLVCRSNAEAGNYGWCLSLTADYFPHKRRRKIMALISLKARAGIAALTFAAALAPFVAVFPAAANTLMNGGTVSSSLGTALATNGNATTVTITLTGSGITVTESEFSGSTNDGITGDLFVYDINNIGAEMSTLSVSNYFASLGKVGVGFSTNSGAPGGAQPTSVNWASPTINFNFTPFNGKSADLYIQTNSTAFNALGSR
jgi:hypothetical protein